ncbi:hypothetical protein F4694_003295 [Bacillus niacini]|uniref:Uncharacterized protein n=1 Tax=Neobacillus niacini TaxID=86668 RepID=A0A852TEQ7_9BACI|nr:hypothetical protein [Neobacillus niacini]
MADSWLTREYKNIKNHGEEQQLIFQGKKARGSVPWKVTASKSKPNGFQEKDEKAIWIETADQPVVSAK